MGLAIFRHTCENRQKIFAGCQFLSAWRHSIYLVEFSIIDIAARLSFYE
jgi:hypothetical protein